MAVTFGFYNSVNSDRKYDAIQMSSIFDGIITDGVFASIGTALVVTPGGGLNVVVGKGRAWFNHTWTNNDSDLILAATPPDVLLDRIDTVILEVDASDAVRANSIKIVEGTPASQPVAPTLTNTTLVHQYPLAHLYMAVGMGTISGARITNKVGTVDCPFIVGIIDTVNISDLLTQWDAEFDQWLANAIEQFQGQPFGTFQMQIDEINTELDTYPNVYASINDVPRMCEGRLGLTTGNPVDTADVTNAATLYFTPYLGNRIALYNGTRWAIYTYAELSLALTGMTANKNFDIFIHDTGGGVLALSHEVWTNDTTRATALVYQDGILVKTGALGYRYLGTIRTHATGQVNDTSQYRHVWNMYNRLQKLAQLYRTGFHTYNSGTWRIWNADATALCSVVIGQPQQGQLVVMGEMSNGGYVGCGVNGTNGTGSYLISNSNTSGAKFSVTFPHTPALGYTTFLLCEFGTATPMSLWAGLVSLYFWG